MLENYKFSSKIKGKNILFLGSVHGNEKCGSQAIDFFVDQFKRKKLFINKGSVVFMPRVNKLAYQKNVRYIDYNLNRIINDNFDASIYESMIAKELKTFIKKSDILVDLHSMEAKTVPMVFVDYDKPKWLELGLASGIKHIILNWPNIYKHGGLGVADTTKYAMSKNIPGITIECGQHKDRGSVAVARKSIINILSYHGLINQDIMSKSDYKNNFYVAEKVFFRKNLKDKFHKNWKNFDFIKKGQVIANGPSGKILSLKDGYILLPKNNAKIKDEWFYLGVRKK